MKRLHAFITFVLPCVLAAFPPAISRAGDVPLLHLVGVISLPGVHGRFDHFADDPDGPRLFVAALGNNTLEVIDPAKLQHTASITGLHKPSGVVWLHRPDRVGVANGGDGSFAVYDATTLRLLARRDGLDDADNVRVDAATGHVFVGHGDGGIAELDTTDLAPLAQIKLPGHPESFQLETAGPRIFVNVPDAARVVVVDRTQRRIVAEWPMTNFRANFPLALDEATHRLFVGCRRPARLVVLDTETGVAVTDLEISGDIDDLFYDARRHRIYASGGEGIVDIVQRHDDDHWERVFRQPTRAGARTCFYSAELDRLFVAVPEHAGQDAEIRVYRPE